MDQPDASNLLGPQLRAYAGAELARAIECLAWRGGRVHSGVHQARKSLRRTRATLALGMPALGPGAELIDRQLRRVNRTLSKLRDAHALVTALDKMIEKQVGDDDAANVLRRARRITARSRAARAHKVLTADPQLQDKRALLSALHAALPALNWSAINVADTGAALHVSETHAHSAGAKARASGDDEDWHRWRRRARRLSQQRRALGDVIARRRSDKLDKRLAVLLGEAQDYALLGEHCGRRSPFAAGDRTLLRALAKQGLLRLRARIAKTLAASLEEAQDTDSPARTGTALEQN